MKATRTLNAAGDALTLERAAGGVAGVQLAQAPGAGDVVPEVALNGADYQPVACTPIGGGAAVTSLTLAGIYTTAALPPGAALRLRANGAFAGPVAVTVTA